jgi:predicted acyltransferase
LGLILHLTGICPIVKRIWTPAWTLFSGGACFILLAVFHWLIEEKGFRRASFPLMVIGMNSIAAYLMAHLFEDFIASSLRIHLGWLLGIFGPQPETGIIGAAVLATYWLMLWWMFRRKIFLRI